MTPSEKVWRSSYNILIKNITIRSNIKRNNFTISILICVTFCCRVLQTKVHYVYILSYFHLVCNMFIPITRRLVDTYYVHLCINDLLEDIQMAFHGVCMGASQYRVSYLSVPQLVRRWHPQYIIDILSGRLYNFITSTNPYIFKGVDLGVLENCTRFYLHM